MTSYEELQQSHPCFGSRKNRGRIHLPVSPGCNIECRFCSRTIDTTSERPGVTAAVISPVEAVSVIREALELCPEISVVGIAGPGDTLATPWALETFRLVKATFPTLLKCMSTNGLLLPEKAGDIIEVGVDSLTVTVNAVDPEIEARLNNRIIFHGEILEGVEAAEILIRNQLEGIRMVALEGITVKVNTVLVPGINDAHIEAIAQAVAKAGASIYNIIPLIPQHELCACPAPDCTQIEKAREQAGRHLDVFRHCQHCRADAIGIPGVSEVGDRIYRNRPAVAETFSHG